MNFFTFSGYKEKTNSETLFQNMPSKQSKGHFMFLLKHLYLNPSLLHKTFSTYIICTCLPPKQEHFLRANRTIRRRVEHYKSPLCLYSHSRLKYSLNFHYCVVKTKTGWMRTEWHYCSILLKLLTRNVSFWKKNTTKKTFLICFAFFLV